MNISRKKCASVLFLAFCFLFVHNIFAGDDDWRPVTPGELQMKAPKVEAGADAEVIFWEVRIDDASSEDLVMKHYLRVKVFNDRGRDQFAKVDIEYEKGERISNVMARVIKPDGSIIPIAKTDVMDREIAKAGDFKIKAKSFALQNVEPGVIVEYQYKVTRSESSAEDMRMVFQRDIPVEKVSYYFKPAANTKILSFNVDGKFIEDKGGYYRYTLENVPALQEEPYMPPKDEVRKWLLVYYQRDLKADYTDFWSRVGGNIVYIYDVKDTLKPDKSLKAAASEITAGASNPVDQVAKVFEFCRTKVKNITFDTSMTDEEKDKIKPTKSTTDTYKKLQGRQDEINELFASMTSALGYETRLVFGGDRSKNFFNPRRAHESFVHFGAVAVRINGRWNYYDPGDLFAPPGMLPWYEEGTSVLLLGYKDYVTTETPLSDYDRSVAKRTADLKLNADGSLEGTVKMEYSGHLGYTYKINNWDDSPAKQEETLKDAIKSRIAGAEVSSITIENANKPDAPFTYIFNIKVPNYAQKAGKRMFMQPGFFEYGVSPLFSSATRKYDIFFRFPWEEVDEVKIKLPEGFALDNADAPPDYSDPEKIGEVRINMKLTSDGTLVYNRRFHFGGGSNVIFPAEAYPAVKKLFDAFQTSSQHQLALRQK